MSKANLPATIQGVMFGKVDGRAMGYGQSYYYSYIKEPLTLDFSQSP